MSDEKQTPRPILVSIPHASNSIPEEVENIVQLTEEEINQYVDLFSEKIYDVGGVYRVVADVCRVIVDVNRAPDDIAKEYHEGHDGVVVHVTQDGKPVYKELPSDELADLMIKKYHDTYHQKIDDAMPNLQFLFDCHTYYPIGPKMKKDAGKIRPDFNIGNLRYSSCSRDYTVFARDFFLDRGFTVGINEPYQCGYVLAHHCHRRRIHSFLVPGLQIEMSHGLYLDSKTFKPLPGRIEEMNKLFGKFIDAFSNRFFPAEK